MFLTENASPDLREAVLEIAYADSQERADAAIKRYEAVQTAEVQKAKAEAAKRRGGSKLGIITEADMDKVRDEWTNPGGTNA